MSYEDSRYYKLNNLKEEIISSTIEYIYESPYRVKKIDGSIVEVDDSNIVIREKKEAANLVRSADEYNFISNFYHTYSNVVLQLCFNNSYYREYSSMFKQWNSEYVECRLFGRIITAFNSALELNFGKPQTGIIGVFIPQNKKLHMKHPSQQQIIGNIEDIALLYDSIPFRKACEDLSKSLNNGNYADVITNARCLIESYCKAYLNKDKISNKTALVDTLKEIYIVPENANDKIKKMSNRLLTIWMVQCVF